MRRHPALPWHPCVLRLAGGLLAASLAACSSTPPRPTGARPASPAAAPAGPTAPATLPPTAPPPAPAPPPELAPEARWLQEWFGATPVKVALDDQGQVRLTVPAVHAFAAGAATPKPALKAVLDRVAQSLARKSGARVLVSVPPGVAGREAAVRSHLAGQGVAAWRVSVQGNTTGGADAATEMLISPGQAAVRKVEDDQLPPPPAPKPVKPAPPRPAASR